MFENCAVNDFRNPGRNELIKWGSEIQKFYCLGRASIPTLVGAVDRFAQWSMTTIEVVRPIKIKVRWGIPMDSGLLE